MQMKAIGVQIGSVGMPTTIPNTFGMLDATSRQSWHTNQSTPSFVGIPTSSIGLEFGTDWNMLDFLVNLNMPTRKLGALACHWHTNIFQCIPMGTTKPPPILVVLKEQNMLDLLHEMYRRFSFIKGRICLCILH